MDPVPSAISSILNALQGTAQPGAPVASPVPALLALIGQDVSLIFQGQTPGGGVSLALPSGQVITAQGQLPYPDGTQLLVRILAGGADAPVRLQIQQALPPAPPAILGPLYQGEAASLLAALGQPDPPPELAPLADLFRLLAGADAQAQPQSLPDAAKVQAALDTLPAPAQAGLKTLLDLPPAASPAATAAALEAWLGAAQGASAAPAGAARSATPSQTPLQTLVQDLVFRFQAALDRHPDLPQAEVLAGWFKQLVTPPEVRPAQGQGAPAPAPAPGSDASAQALQTLLGGRSGAAAEAPETWETWLRASIKTLSDPAAAPQGAAFHAAQAKEGTAYYEIPLPWAPQNPLQMWLESDQDPRGQGDPREETQRVLIGLTFTNLGETRVGIARRGADLRVRVWTEHPELLEASRSGMEEELRDLGGGVDLQILPLAPGPDGTIPTVRGQVAGANLQAMG